MAIWTAELGYRDNVGLARLDTVRLYAGTEAQAVKHVQGFIRTAFKGRAVRVASLSIMPYSGPMDTPRKVKG